jgi:hypothetical protein
LVGPGRGGGEGDLRVPGERLAGRREAGRLDGDPQHRGARVAERPAVEVEVEVQRARFAERVDPAVHRRLVPSGRDGQLRIADANEGARVLVVGVLSGQLAPQSTGRRAPVELDSMEILLKKLTLRGYSADDDPDAQQEWNERSGAWVCEGRISFPSTRVKGIEHAVEALFDAMAGKHFGTVIVEL